VTAPSTAARWWEGAAFYQVYVRSFRDTDGDGNGDLNGVIEKLDHLSWLGVDALWLSPTMPSPDDDWGYDVADYVGVHPELGTTEDLDRLIAEAGRLGMRILLDLVPNHSSAQHPWFVAARASRQDPHRQFYVWADPAPGGGPPNNWRDFTGEAAWTLETATGQYYLHKFLPSQPDLNWWNPEVHRAFTEVLAFWLDRGVAGFRIDVAEGLYHDHLLRDDPPAAAGDPRGEGGLRRKFSSNRPQVHQVYRNWRDIAERYSPPKLLLGETWMVPLSELGAYYGANDELQLAFNFPFILTEFTADALRATVAATLAGLPTGACPIWTASNHDLSRFPTRWCGNDERKIRLALTVLLMLPGTVMLYYGDELGLVDVDVPVEDQRDPMTMDGRGGAPSRDRARTPMPWNAEAGGGFASSGIRPWLPLGDNAATNVADQRTDPDSIASSVRALLALRRQELSGAVARYEELAGGPDQWVYRAGPLVVAANMSGRAAPADVTGEMVFSTQGGDHAASDGDAWVLAPWEAIIVTP
jgi:alpha-glucosidase